MKAFRTLLKLAGRNLETLRRELADQLAKLSSVEQRMLGHEQTIISEQKLAQRDYESARAYGGYAVAAVSIRKALSAEQEMIQWEIERLRALISEAHVETRKFERLIELDEARQKAVREKRENAELDELATLRSARAGRARLQK